MTTSKMRDLGLAFNDEDFSDRILRLELVRDSLDSDSDANSDAEECDSSSSNKKQKTENSTETGDAASSDEESSNASSTTVVKVRTFHIISAVLSSCSPYFLKLFKNGMRESQEKCVTLKIDVSEEVAFMDLLKFMYTNTLTALRATELLGVLMIADKFEVRSCMNYCSKKLEDMPMSLESALLYLEIPSSVSVCELVQSLIDDAKDYLCYQYPDLIKRKPSEREEAMTWPLSAIEAVLSGEIQVRSEEDVYEFIIKWGRARYPKQKERQEVLTKLIERYIHFPYMSISTLKKIQDCPDFDSKQISNLILESLYMNAGQPYGERYRIPRAKGQQFIRDYDYLPIKETQFGSCHVVYLNIDNILCGHLKQQGRFSQVFCVGGQLFKFWVDARSIDDEENCLGLFLECHKGNNGTCTFDYELEVEKGVGFAMVDYESIYKFENCCLSVGNRVGSPKLLGIPLEDLMKMPKYFSSDMLYLRAQFTIKNSLPIDLQVL